MTGKIGNNAWIAVLVLGIVLAGLYFSDSDVISIAAYNGAALLAVIALISAALVSRPQMRSTWRLLAAGVIAYYIGDVIWELGVLLFGQDLLVMCLTAPFYIGAALLSSLAFLRWTKLRHTGSEREDTVDAAIVTLSFAVVSWMFIIGPRLNDPTVSLNIEAFAVVYAALDLFPLALLVRMALRRDLARYRALGFFIAGGMVLAVADGLYGWGELTGNAAAYETLADTGWLLWYIFWAAAALDPTARALDQAADPAPEPVNPSNGKRFAVLTVIALVAPLSIVLGALDSRPLDTMVVAVGTIAIFGLVIYRMALVVRSLETVLSAQERLQSELASVAYYDALTGLVNRAFLNVHLDDLLRDRAQPDIALLFLDLDNFKEVNDRFGHASGDRFLVELARRLESCTRDTDVVARLGGDEFLIILDLNGRAARQAASATARRILKALALPARLGAETVAVSASIGIAWPGDDATSVDSILGAADSAMYAAKRAGKNRFRIAPEPALHRDEHAASLKRSA